MAFTVEFWAFSKKENSTKQPTTGSGIAYTNVLLKDETSILNPVLKVAVSSMPVPSVAPVNTMTYCYIPKFGRYYFITDWVYNQGIWECSLAVDVLASFKTPIGATSAYIERSASAYDGNIIDKLYPANTNYSITRVALSAAYLGVPPSGGCYVVGVINSVANTAGAITYYAMSQTQLANLLAYMFGNDIWTSSGITEISQGLFKSMFNPMQYIVSCMWLPIGTSSLGNTTGTVYIGYYNTNITATLVTYLFEKGHVTGTITSHPQAASRGSYLNYAPYTDITLYIPPFGSIPIDTAFLKKGNHLYCPYWVDHITGEATIQISLSAYDPAIDSNVCAERSAKMGVPIQIAQVMADYSHTVQTMQSGLSGGIAGIIAGALGATVQSALDAKFPQVSTSGSNGSFASNQTEAHAILRHTQIVDGDNTDFGRPLMAVRTINTLSGYVKCGEAHPAIPCLQEELSMITNYLTSGFFYE